MKLLDLITKLLQLLISPKDNKEPVISEIDPKVKQEPEIQLVTLVRKEFRKDGILGIMYLNDKEICRTLENIWLNNEEYISCIPVGSYRVVKDNTGKFKYWRIKGVPNRTLIEIHNGNNEDATKGCILVGNKWGTYKKKSAVLSSLITLERLKTILKDEFIINITNH